MARKLKVFQTQLGFYDSVVAAPSQAAALRAWGTHHDLFADGMAKVATDEKAIQAALASPETVLRRAIGTTDPFNLTPGLPSLPDMPPTAKAGKAKLRLVKSNAATPVASSKPPPPPDRSALDRAEAARKHLEQQRSREELALRQELAAVEAEEVAIARRRAAVEERQSAALKAHEHERSKVEAVLKRERQAYEKAAGQGTARR